MQNNLFTLVENYIYIYQLNKYLIIPTYPEQINDSIGSSFAQTNILSRTAPIYSYSYSGPRKIQFSINLHRDMMYQFNRTNLNFIDEVGRSLNEDYVDTLIRYLQAMALPSYTAGQVQTAVVEGKLVNPPAVAVRFGNTLFIKGIVDGEVGVSHSGAIDSNKKYKEVSITFSVAETEPQDAETIAKWGSFRGLETVLTRNLYKGS